MPVDLQELAQRCGVETLDALPRDVSPREYFRGRKGGKDVIIMLYPTPNDEARKEMQEFIRIAGWLNEQGVKAPALYDMNMNECWAVFEDLGKTSFGRALADAPVRQEELYTNAVTVLKTLAKAGFPENGLPDYNDSRIHENKKQFIDYCLTFLRQERQSNSVTQSFLDAWSEVEKALPNCPKGFVHGDYHLENLMLQRLEGAQEQCALIDFQDALYGPLPYDLVNILEDARMSVPKGLQNKMISHYCDGLFDGAQKEAFLKWYRVLGTQFHCRVIGLFIKLAAEQGRDSYLIHIERLANYITDALDDPTLSPIKTWFEKEGVDFTALKDIDGQKIRKVFDRISAS